MESAPSSSSTTAGDSRAAEPALARAIALAGTQRFASARRAIDEAVAAAPDDPRILAVAGIVGFVVGEYHRSLEELARAARLARTPALEWLVAERASRIGWYLDARAAMERGAAAEPEEPRWHAAQLAFHARRRAVASALREGELALARAPDSASTAMELAGMHALRGDRTAVERLVGQALDVARTVPLLLESARLLRSVGAFDAARDRWEAALARAPDDPTATLGLAELALWSGDHASAAERVTASSALVGSSEAERVLGAIAFLEGRRDEARAHLRRSLARDPDGAEAHAWLAQIALHEGHYDEAHRHVASATTGDGGSIFVGRLLRLRIELEERLDARFPFRNDTEHLHASLRALCPGSDAVVRGDDRGAWRSMLDEALLRMRGNRSSVATFWDDGVLRPVPSQRDPRQESRRILERVRVDDAETLLVEFEALSSEFPRSGLPLAHAGELLLWLGRIDEAEVALRRAITTAHATRWAYIGLGAVSLVRDDPREALRILEEGVQAMEGTTGPAVYLHRAEAHYLLGHLSDAEADLHVAFTRNPTRMANHLVHGLVCLERGDVDAARNAASAIFRNAPGLAADAARELGIALFGDAPVVLDRDTLRALLLHVRRMLRGNRSSSGISYVTAEGRLRFDVRGGVDPRAHDAADLQLASIVLRNGLSALPRPGSSRSRRTATRRAGGSR